MGANPSDDGPERIDRSDIIFYLVMGLLFLFAIIMSKHQQNMNDNYDFTYKHQGSVITLTPQTNDARTWCDLNIPPESYFSPDTIVIEFRCWPDILDGILSEPLTIRKL